MGLPDIYLQYFLIYKSDKDYQYKKSPKHFDMFRAFGN